MIALAIFIVVALSVIMYFLFKNKPSDSKIIPTPTPSKSSYLEIENPWVRLSDGTCKKYNEALATGYSPINFPCLSPTCSGTKNNCETLPVIPPAPIPGPVNPPPAPDCTTIPESCSNVKSQVYCKEHGKECVQCYTDILNCNKSNYDCTLNCTDNCPFQTFGLPTPDPYKENDYATNACVWACNNTYGDGPCSSDKQQPQDPPECPGLNKAWNDYGGRDGNACDNPNFMAVGKQCYDNLLIKDKVDRDGSGNCTSACDNLESVLQIPVCNNICTSACKKETFVNRRR